MLSFQTSWGFVGAAARSLDDECSVNNHHTFRTLVHRVMIQSPVDSSIVSVEEPWEKNGKVWFGVRCNLEYFFSQEFVQSTGRIQVYRQQLTRFDAKTGTKSWLAASHLTHK